MTIAAMTGNEAALGGQNNETSAPRQERAPEALAAGTTAAPSEGARVEVQQRGRQVLKIGLGIALGAVILAHLLIVHLYHGGVQGMREHLEAVRGIVFTPHPIYPWNDHILALIRPAHRIVALASLGLLLVAGGVALLGRRSARARWVAWISGLGAVAAALVSQLAQVEHWTLSASMPWGSFLLPARGLLIGLAVTALGFAGGPAFRRVGSGPGVGTDRSRVPGVRSLTVALATITISLVALMAVPTAPLHTRPREAIAVCENGLTGDDHVFAGYDACFPWGARRAEAPVAQLLGGKRRARALRLARGSRDLWASGHVPTAPMLGPSPPGREAFFPARVSRMTAHYGNLEVFNLRWNQVRAPAVALLPFGALGLLGLTLLLWLRGRRSGSSESSPLPGWLRWAWGAVGALALLLSVGLTPVLSNWAWWYYLPGALVLPLAVAFGLLSLRRPPHAALS